MTTVAIYARCAIKGRDESELADQIQLCRSHAEREGWTVTLTCADHGYSGSSPARPEMDRLVSAIRGREIDVVLAGGLDRFSRSSTDLDAFIEIARRAHVRIVTLADGDVTRQEAKLRATTSVLSESA
jgi:DNA invertase Pin-like site-specific DNA recombinase